MIVSVEFTQQTTERGFNSLYTPFVAHNANTQRNKKHLLFCQQLLILRLFIHVSGYYQRTEKYKKNVHLQQRFQHVSSKRFRALKVNN